MNPEVPMPLKCKLCGGTHVAKFDCSTIVAENWLRAFCKEHNGNFDRMVTAARSRKKHHHDTIFYTYDGAMESQTPEFWRHMNTYLGREDTPREERPYFSCSC